MIAGLLKRFLGGKGAHADFRDIASDYVDGDVGGDALQKADGHLGMCGPCRAFLQTLRATVSLLKSMPERKAPATLKSDILKAVSRKDE